MLNFDFQSPTRILFGKDEESRIGELLKPHAKKVLVHYGGGSVKRSGLLDRVCASLIQSQIAYIELGGVVPNPRLSLVREGIELCRDENVDYILALGGGSVIDSAKSIAMGVFFEGDVWEIFEAYNPIQKALPIATVLTIPAAGSETSAITVLSNEDKQLKLSFGSPHLHPRLSIINPELFFSLPKNQIANGIADMMSHVFERYFTNTVHTDLTDGLCESLLKTVMTNARLVIDDPYDYEAWCEIGFSAMLAHNGLLGMGRQQDWACHGMEHELSALYDVAHGAGLAVLTPAWMRYVYHENIPMFMQFAVNVMGVDSGFRHPDALIEQAIGRLQEFYKRMGLPLTLRELDINDSQLELMAEKATRASRSKRKPLGGLKPLDTQDVLAIYRLAL